MDGGLYKTDVFQGAPFSVPLDGWAAAGRLVPTPQRLCRSWRARV